MTVDTLEKWEEFLRKYYRDHVIRLAGQYPDKRSLFVDFTDIDQYDSAMAEDLLEEPDSILPGANDALRQTDLPTGITLSEAHVRVIGIPAYHRIKIRNLRGEHISKLVTMEGLVRKATEVRPKIVEAAFECSSGHILLMPQVGRKFQEPQICPECGRKVPFRLNHDKSKFVDAQKIMVQESPEELRGGEQPQTMDINLDDDLSGIVSPGDRIIVTGIPRSYQRRLREGGMSNFFDVIIEGISIEQEEQEFEQIETSPEEEEEILKLAHDPDIYNKVIQSITPTIYGYNDVKEAIALQLFSGVIKTLPDGSRIRGDIHVLLVGDPGTGKSQILSYVSNLAPRGIYSSGQSTTAAGLTATAVKDEFGEGRWTLEAGALVLADGGIACIDELDKMQSHDRSALHEAMEQQTISVAKAGIMATFKSRCSLLGAANPKEGRFNPYDSVPSQINLSPALLSRFDLIFPLIDRPDKKVDSDIATHILNSHREGEIGTRARILGKISDFTRPAELRSAGLHGSSVSPDKSDMSHVTPIIMPELLRKCVAYSKRSVFPVIGEEAAQSFKDFYVGLRGGGRGDGSDSPIPVTARGLEALVRLGEASARIRLSDTITLDDANRAIRVMLGCLKQVSLDRETGQIDSDIISLGIPKSQKDKIRLLKEIVRELDREYGGGAPRNRIIAKAEENGIDHDMAEELIARLKRQGDLFEPKAGIIRLT